MSTEVAQHPRTRTYSWMVQVLPSGWVAAQKGPDIRGQFMRIKEAKKFAEATYQLEVTE